MQAGDPISFQAGGLKSTGTGGKAAWHRTKSLRNIWGFPEMLVPNNRRFSS